MSIGDFLNEKSSQQKETEEILRRAQQNFRSEFIALNGKFSDWLSKEIADNQLKISSPEGLGNINGTPPAIVIDIAKFGSIRLTPQPGVHLGSRGIAEFSYNGKRKTLTLKEDGWKIKGEEPLSYIDLNKDSFSALLIELLK